MSASYPYILVAIVVLIAVMILAFVIGHRQPHTRLTPLAGLAFAFALAGVLFGENRIIGYGLLGIAVILAIMDLVQHSRSG